MDSLRERAFSGFDSFREPERSKSGIGRIVLFVVLLAALGAAGWWAYGYLDAAENRKSSAESQSAGKVVDEIPADGAATQAPSPTAAPPSDAGSPQVSPPVVVAEGRSDHASGTASGSGNARSGNADVPPPNAGAEPKAAAKSIPATPKAARREQIEEKREARASSAKASKLPEPAAATKDSGDADFRKGEAYLYGRGAPKNCDEAVKYLKAAAAKSSSKARSAFGTMYATGHCVPRDLPTSYLWFAMALRVDPNNQIVEKDLSAIWNQMTPPERQLATRMKQ
jgi:hypothetical protein